MHIVCAALDMQAQPVHKLAAAERRTIHHFQDSNDGKAGLA